MYLTVVPVVRLVLVIAVALVSAGADTYDCIHWGYFQYYAPESTYSSLPQAFHMIMCSLPNANHMIIFFLITLLTCY